MSIQSNDQGRAFEFITLMILRDMIAEVRSVEVEKNSSLIAARRAWNSISPTIQDNLKNSAVAAAEAIFELEPLILEDDGDVLTLLIQKDRHGEEGDVRDILIIRSGIRWEIGLSLKHNHFAVKHSRLGKNLDFGDKWFGVPCSDNYWDEIAPIFHYLDDMKARGANWNQLPNKSGDVYTPLLNAFMNEVERSARYDRNIPRKMVEYLLGEYDFYKVVGLDRSRMAQILTFNLRGTLNQDGRRNKPNKTIPIANLPSRIVKMEFKPGSDNTIELYMDEGWQFSFRIHNAATKVETSLKFDVQIIGMPTTIVSINCIWR